MKVFSSWSGGKECTLATYKAMAAGHEVLRLVNFIREDGLRSRSHGVRAEVLALQAEALGIPIVQTGTTWEDYEATFKRVVGELKEQGIEAGVFGDIDLEEHREWVERVCCELGIQALLPLWKMERQDVIGQFLGAGFKALVVATRLSKQVAGSSFDRALVERMAAMGADPCGEQGEYHTFVTAGPLFKRPLKVTPVRVEEREGMWFMDVTAEL